MATSWLAIVCAVDSDSHYSIVQVFKMSNYNPFSYILPSKSNAS